MGPPGVSIDLNCVIFLLVLMYYYQFKYFVAHFSNSQCISTDLIVRQLFVAHKYVFDTEGLKDADKVSLLLSTLSKNNR